MFRFQFIAPALVCLGLFTACNNDDGGSGPGGGGTVTQRLVGKNWKLTAFTVSPGINVLGTVITDIYAQMDACDKDDIVIFNANGTTTEDEGATKCDPSDPQTASGSWVLNPAQTVLTWTDSDGDATSLTITSLTATSATLTFTEQNPQTGVTHTFTMTITAS